VKLTGPCCPPAPWGQVRAASYKRHRRAQTVPCLQSLADASAYNLARRKARLANAQEVQS